MKSAQTLTPQRGFLLLWVSLMYLWGVVYLWNWSQQLHIALLFVPGFTALMGLHLGLYWYGSTRQTSHLWSGYVLIQSLLVLLLGLLSLDWTMAFGLLLALICDITSVLQRVRLSLLVALGYLILLLCIASLEGSWVRFAIWLGIFPQGPASQLPLPFSVYRLLNILQLSPLLLFVVGYLILFAQQARSRERAEQLLKEQARSHAELEEAYARIAAYAGQVEHLTLRVERQRMARELHDTLSQGLSGLIMQLEVVDALLTEQRTEYACQRAQEIVRETMASARDTLAEARTAIADLRGTAQCSDFPDALRQAVSHFTVVTGIPCFLETGTLDSVPSMVREQALSAVPEVLTNVARHAQAQGVWLRADYRNEILDLDIRDDGRGFVPETVTGKAGHYGLLGLRERVRLTNGTMSIQSTPGEGTTLHLRFGARLREGERDHE